MFEMVFGSYWKHDAHILSFLHYLCTCFLVRPNHQMPETTLTVQ